MLYASCRFILKLKDLKIPSLAKTDIVVVSKKNLINLLYFFEEFTVVFSVVFRLDIETVVELKELKDY
jgi:hypothetical protein